MKPKNVIREWISFSTGVLCVLASIAGAFIGRQWIPFVVLFVGGCNLMGKRSIWEKVLVLVKKQKRN
jgi:hypothetical protein